MKNSYTIDGGKALIQLSNGPVAVVDVEDLPAVAAHPNTWYAHHGRSTDYAYMNTGGRSNHRMLVMHRVIAAAEDRSIHVDHIDMNGMNNSRSNLRLCTASENAQNVRRARPDSATGVKGVSPVRNKFRARVRLHGKEYHLGVFDTVEEASVAAAAGRLKYHTHSPEATSVASAA